MLSMIFSSNHLFNTLIIIKDRKIRLFKYRNILLISKYQSIHDPLLLNLIDTTNASFEVTPIIAIITYWHIRSQY